MAVIKCGNCRFESLQAGTGPCADCCGFSEWKPIKPKEGKS